MGHDHDANHGVIRFSGATLQPREFSSSVIVLLLRRGIKRLHAQSGANLYAASGLRGDCCFSRAGVLVCALYGQKAGFGFAFAAR
jgi:hypothetical protein